MSEIIRNYGYIGPNTPNRRYDTTVGQLMNGFPIGILQLWAHLPFFPGNVSNAYTYDFPVKFIEVKGSGIDNVLAGDMSIVDNIIEAAKQLEKDGCRAICANCGFFGHYQRLVSDQLDVPCYLSAMVQVPWVLVGLKSSQKLGIMTANKNTLTPSLFEACGISTEMQKRCVVYGAQDEKEFPNILTGKAVWIMRCLATNCLELPTEWSRKTRISARYYSNAPICLLMRIGYRRSRTCRFMTPLL